MQLDMFHNYYLLMTLKFIKLAFFLAFVTVLLAGCDSGDLIQTGVVTYTTITTRENCISAAINYAVPATGFSFAVCI